jgi:hypothetical protein
MASGGMGRRRPTYYEVTARAGLRGEGSAQFGLSGPATAGLGPAHPAGGQHRDGLPKKILAIDNMRAVDKL